MDVKLNKVRVCIIDLREQRMMYVGPNTIDASLSMKYFNIFVSQYNDVLDLAQIQGKLSVNLSCGVIELIGSFARKEDLTPCAEIAVCPRKTNTCHGSSYM